MPLSLNEREKFPYNILFILPGVHFAHAWAGCRKLFKCNINKKDNNAMFTKVETPSNRDKAAVHQFFFTAKSGAELPQTLETQFWSVSE